MSCADLGFDEYGGLRVSKSADVQESIVAPVDYDFDSYTAARLQVRATESAASALLSITLTPTAAGSKIVFNGRFILLTIKAADSATLPAAADPDAPWVGVYELVLTDAEGLSTRLVDGVFTAEKGVVR